MSANLILKNSAVLALSVAGLTLTACANGHSSARYGDISAYEGVGNCGAGSCGAVAHQGAYGAAAGAAGAYGAASTQTRYGGVVLCKLKRIRRKHTRPLLRLIRSRLLATRSPLLAIRHHLRHMARVLKQIAQLERQCSQMEPVCKGRPAIQRRQAHIAQVAHMRGLLQDLLIQDLL